MPEVFAGATPGIPREGKAMKPTFCIGIDPGKSGGIAVLAGLLEEATKMPDTERDIVELLKEYRETAATMGMEAHCWVEAVHAFPKMGSVSAFTFGRGFGVVIGVLAALNIPYEFVQPPVWQQALGCTRRGSKSKAAHKNSLKAKAQALFPKVPNITHSIADSLLIARYGQQKGAV